MKGLSKIMSVLLIASACFGVYGSSVGIKDILSSKDYWEDKGVEANENIDKLEDGINKLAENEQAYTAGVDQVAQGEKDLAKGRADFASGQAQFEQGKKDLAAGEKKLADGKKTVADGEKQVTAGKAALKALEPLLQNIGRYQGLYQQADFQAKYSTSLTDANAIKSQLQTYGNTLVQAGQNLGDDGASLVTAGQGILANIQGLATSEQAKSAPVAAFAQRVNANNGAQDIGFNPILSQVISGLSSKAAEIDTGLTQLAGGIQQIDNGLAQVNAGLSQFEGIPDASLTDEQIAQRNGLQQKKAQLEQEKAGYEAQQTKLTAMKTQLTALKTNAEALVSALNDWLANDYSPIAPQNNAQLSALGGGIVKALIDNGLVTGAEAQQLSAYDTSDKIKASGAPEVLVTLNSVFDKVNATVDQKKAELAAGERALAAGKAEVAKGEKDLAAGKAKLDAAEQELAAGAAKLADGEETLAAGKAKLAEYEDGEAQLVEGLETLLGTEGYTGVDAIAARLGDDFNFMKDNDKNVDLAAAMDAVKAGREFLDDTNTKVTGELMPKLYGNIAVIAAALLALLSGIFGLRRKNKAAAITAGIASVAAIIGAFLIHNAGTEMSEIAGSTLLGAGLYAGALVLAVVGIVQFITNFGIKKDA